MKPGYRTTEFHMAITATAIAMVAGNAWAVAAIAIAYNIVRAYVKARPNGVYRGITGDF